MLRVRSLEAGYGPLKVLRGLNLDVPAGKIVALLGGNGAGKTTTMHALVGILPVSGGTVEFEREPIHGLASHRIFKRGIALVAQGRQLFPEMTVRENLELGALGSRTSNDVEALIAENFERFPRLRERAENRAASLSGGEQQMLATGRALMSRPSMLLLDEPTTGLAPIIVAELARIIRSLNESGLTVLIVEQNVRVALKIADHVYVMRNGVSVVHKPASDFADDDETFKSYLS
jgi:branched-chain amino acid transport system ATP-binding protein